MYIDVMIEKKDNYPMAFWNKSVNGYKINTTIFFKIWYDMYFVKHLNIHRTISANTQECAGFKSINFF